jgi:hypothetical protein
MPCPVTTPGTAFPPKKARMNFDSVLTSDRTGWVGSGALWTQLPPNSVIEAVWDSDTYLMRTKLGWFRAVPGNVKVSGVSLEAPAAVFQSDVGTVPEYGPTGFTPSGLEFGRPGCWRITGALGRARLTVIVDVVPPTP